MIACDMQPKLAQSANTGTAAPGPACDQSIEDGLVDPLLSQSGVEEIARRAPREDSMLATGEVDHVLGER